MKPFRAVVFDFDGTLADTMPDHFRAWQAVMADYGIQLAPDDYYPLEGVRVADLPRRFFEKYGQSPRDEDTILRNKERYYLAHHRFAFYPGVETLIRELREKNIPLGVVTAGLLERLQRSVPARFLAQFNAIVTGDETTEGKPSPQPYLRGAQKLGVHPTECIVVENAPIGVASAKRAGAYCIALSTTVPADQLTQADEVVGTFDDLKEVLLMKRLLASSNGSDKERRDGTRLS